MVAIRRRSDVYVGRGGGERMLERFGGGKRREDLRVGKEEKIWGWEEEGKIMGGKRRKGLGLWEEEGKAVTRGLSLCVYLCFGYHVVVM